MDRQAAQRGAARPLGAQAGGALSERSIFSPAFVVRRYTSRPMFFVTPRSHRASSVADFSMRQEKNLWIHSALPGLNFSAAKLMAMRKWFLGVSPFR